MDIFSNWMKAKGEPGHIKSLKIKELTVTLVMFALSAAIFLTGYIMNGYDKGNVLTIIAALGIIPMARALTGFILVVPFKSAPAEYISEVEGLAKAGSLIYTDCIFTSTEKAMGGMFMVITSSKILILKGLAKEKASKLEDYLNDFVKRKGFDYKVTVVDDMAKYKSLLKNSDSLSDIDFGGEQGRENFDKDRAELCDALESLMM